MSDKIFPSYENVVLDEEIISIQDVDNHYIRSLSFALDDYRDWYIDGGREFSKPIAPSEGIAKDLVALFLERYDHNAVVGLHQKEEIFFFNPALQGSRLTFKGKYTDKYLKRGKGYTVFDTEAIDENGIPIVRQISTEIMRIPDKIELGSGSGSKEIENKVETIWPGDEAIIQRFDKNTKPGDALAPLKKMSRQDQMTVFSQGGKNYHNIHTDDFFAIKNGFKTTVTQGMQTTCWTVGMLINFFGKSWLTGGWIKMVFLKPVYWKEEVTAKAIIKNVDGNKVSLEVWIEKHSGEVTSVGWATCTI